MASSIDRNLERIRAQLAEERARYAPPIRPRKKREPKLTRRAALELLFKNANGLGMQWRACDQMAAWWSELQVLRAGAKTGRTPTNVKVSRNQEIVEAAANGETVRAIAARLGISHQRVQQVASAARRRT